MKTTPNGSETAAAESMQQRLMHGINSRDEQMEVAAAMLLLLGNELVRLNENGGTWSDDKFGGFIAAGLINITHTTSQALYEASKKRP